MRSAGSRSRVVSAAAITLTSITCRHSSTGVSATASRLLETPALWTSTSSVSIDSSAVSRAS
ncbi:hypothetical protein SCNU_13108 [Gordonia neofelifaecis NRRL B-59395]|uniref:Uncharacterized protein n=1 Tax=Gordonia neofelifaecis NRRL B-59395 TaxID=644548 RepID=F1YL64_9ACTN|nr:hypothetical protein SCNU_13108 [Gordonia neofelifaecis NRRL B-59395]